jgi:beta-glucosidase
VVEMVRNVFHYNRIDPVVEARADSLLARLALEEKVGQMVQAPSAPYLDAEIRSGLVGSVLSINDLRHINRLQHIAVEESRLGIPLLIGNDVIHGYRTIFPIPLAESCTWDPGLIERTARVAATEAGANGTNWIFAPMVDVARDPRWGRVAEGAGEDPFLGAALARARVRGFQAADLPSGRRVAACPKHYAAYGAAEAGREYNTVDLSEHALRDVYLPPFSSAFDAGAGTVMTSLTEINGIPASAHPTLLRTILRDEWGFVGVVLTDYEAIGELVPHGVASDLREAAAKAALATVDMDMVAGAFRRHLLELVRDGTIEVTIVDDAVRRILRLKIMLGLFEHPYADEAVAEEVVLSHENRALALEAAQKSIVLLKNDGNLLPLTGTERLAVIGPLADDAAAPLGCWASMGRPRDVETVLDGLRAVWREPGSITYVPGCGDGFGTSGDLTAAVAAAGDADVVVLVLGEDAGMSGEAHSRAHLGLPGRQLDLLKAVYATETPAVAVLMSGRPLVVPWIAEHIPAVIQAWHGGIRSGRALADVLVGTVNPSGKLTMSFPRAEGQIPVYYAQKPTGRPGSGFGTTQFDESFKSGFLDIPNEPEFAFGHGLAYTAFVYSQLAIETPVLGPEDTLAGSVVVTNSGDRAGDEIVQLYVRDLVASVTRPVKELKGFQRISLQPQASQIVRLTVPVDQLGFHDPSRGYVVEPGRFKLWIGPDSAHGLEGEFEVVPGR